MQLEQKSATHCTQWIPTFKKIFVLFFDWVLFSPYKYWQIPLAVIEKRKSSWSHLLHACTFQTNPHLNSQENVLPDVTENHSWTMVGNITKALSDISNMKNIYSVTQEMSLVLPFLFCCMGIGNLLFHRQGI